MASIDWPTSGDFPQDMIIDGYGQGAAPNLLRSPMEIGPAKQRRRSTAGPKPIKGYVVVTASQLGTFKSWYTNTALDGSLRFDWLDPDDGVTEVEMRFVYQPSWIREPKSADLWRINLDLEIMP